MAISHAFQKLIIYSTGALVTGLVAFSASSARAVQFSFEGTTTGFGDFIGSYIVDNSALGSNTIDASSIRDFNLILGGTPLINNENPDSGSLTFDSPFTGKLTDFDLVSGSLNFLSGTNFSISNGGVISGTNPALNNGNPIVGQLTANAVVPEPATPIGLAAVGLLGSLMLKKKVFSTKTL